MKKTINVLLKKMKSVFKKDTTLIVLAEKAIKKYNKGVTFERTYFEATVVGNGKVEMIGLIDGGPLVNRKVCSNNEEVGEFIASTSATYQ